MIYRISYTSQAVEQWVDPQPLQKKMYTTKKIIHFFHQFLLSNNTNHLYSRSLKITIPTFEKGPELPSNIFVSKCQALPKSGKKWPSNRYSKMPIAIGTCLDFPMANPPSRPQYKHRQILIVGTHLEDRGPLIITIGRGGGPGQRRCQVGWVWPLGERPRRIFFLKIFWGRVFFLDQRYMAKKKHLLGFRYFS